MIDAQASIQHGVFTITSHFEIEAGKMQKPHKFTVRDDKGRQIDFDRTGIIMGITLTPTYHFLLADQFADMSEVFEDARDSFLAIHFPADKN
jgi:hypothetical protein